jgi:hypothetical protein
MGVAAFVSSAALVILAQGVPEAATSPPDATRAALGDYLRCQQAATRALDDGHSSEDVIATQTETRCEAQYQTYRQAWSERAGPGAPDQRAWNMDNERQARARAMVHSYRLAMARIADINSCVSRVADEFRSETFDHIVDQGVLRCGALIPFPVPPVERQATMTEQQIHERQERQDRTTRSMVAAELRKILKVSPSPGE